MQTFFSRWSRHIDMIDHFAAGDIAYPIIERVPGQKSVGFCFHMRWSSDAVAACALFRVSPKDAEAFGQLAGNLWMMQRTLGSGLKVFRPTATECLALEEVEIAVGAEDYAQPFPTLVVEFPEEYADVWRDRAVRPIDDEPVCVPRGVIVSHLPDDRTVIAGTIIDTDGASSVLLTVLLPADDMTLEASLSDISVRLPAAEMSGFGISKRCVRVAVNACLLLMSGGFRRVNDDESDRASDALRRAKAKRRPEAEIDALRLTRRLTPTVISFEHHTDVRAAVGPAEAVEAVDDGSPLRRLSPHWRQAHWRRQAYGKGLAQTRRILIPHTMVNRALFVGKPSAAVTVRD